MRGNPAKSLANDTRSCGKFTEPKSSRKKLGMRRSLGLLVCASMLVPASSGYSRDSNTLENFYATLTVCAAGSQLTFDANMKSSLEALFKQGRSKPTGRSKLQIKTRFLE